MRGAEQAPIAGGGPKSPEAAVAAPNNAGGGPGSAMWNNAHALHANACPVQTPCKRMPHLPVATSPDASPAQHSARHAVRCTAPGGREGTPGPSLQGEPRRHTLSACLHLRGGPLSNQHRACSSAVLKGMRHVARRARDHSGSRCMLRCRRALGERWRAATAPGAGSTHATIGGSPESKSKPHSRCARLGAGCSRQDSSSCSTSAARGSAASCAASPSAGREPAQHERSQHGF